MSQYGSMARHVLLGQVQYALTLNLRLSQKRQCCFLEESPKWLSPTTIHVP